MPQCRSENKSAVVGVFPLRARAEKCLDVLRLSGFGNADVSVILPGHEKTGGVIAWLNCVGPVMAPRCGLLLAAGPLVPALIRYGVSGALPGSSGAEQYELRVRQGAVLVAIHCSNIDRIALASEILERLSAEDIAVPTALRASASA